MRVSRWFKRRMPMARLCALALAILATSAFAVDPRITVIKAGVLIDGTGGTPLRSLIRQWGGSAARAGAVRPSEDRKSDSSLQSSAVPCCERSAGSGRSPVRPRHTAPGQPRVPGLHPGGRQQLLRFHGQRLPVESVLRLPRQLYGRARPRHLCEPAVQRHSRCDPGEHPNSGPSSRSDRSALA
jgi:hypothetical protein